jgi:hypothetical protein
MEHAPYWCGRWPLAHRRTGPGSQGVDFVMIGEKVTSNLKDGITEP